MIVRNLANAVGYQLVWLASVTGAGHGLPWAGPIAAVAFCAMALALSDKLRADLQLIPIALVVGFVVDSAWIASGMLDYNAAWPSMAFAPAWILGLWVSLALTLNHSFAFLKHRYALASLLGGIGGPLSYWSASKAFGAAHFDASASVVMGAICIVWAVIFPLLVRVAERSEMPPAAAAPKSREAHP